MLDPVPPDAVAFVRDFGSFRWAESVRLAGFPVRRTHWTVGVFRVNKDNWPVVLDEDLTATDWRLGDVFDNGLPVTRECVAEVVADDAKLTRTQLLDLLAAIEWGDRYGWG